MQGKEMMDLNVWGVIHGTKIGSKIMKQQGFGHIINTASAAGLGPAPIATAYSSTKYAVVGLTTSLHYEAEKFGIKVSCHCPAFTDTPIFDKAKGINIERSVLTRQLKKQKLMKPQQLAKMTFDAAHKNKLLIAPLPMCRTTDVIFTVFPSLHKGLMRLVCKASREARLT
ncbi:SDR family NAD(P)-dependent oxidoreductase [Neobacillus dielmonensis]|uniref:SDR family NAD(P)-dependent oxidoreductase n=1 Tax=Neobacillus dielmonensis TaxID=1347369 RepID=UPI00069325C3|nr:SDR family NAD(P)-dependent oxidoreductase [Neobacillus dielmonensis]